MNSEAVCRVYFFLVALKNHDILNSQLFFTDTYTDYSNWLLPLLQCLQIQLVGLTLVPDPRVTFTGLKSQCLCWKSISFIYSVSFQYSYGILLLYLSKGMATVIAVPLHGPLFLCPKQTAWFSSQKHILFIIYIPNFFLHFTRKHPFGKSAHLIGEIFCLGSPEIQSCLVAFPNFYDAKYAYIPYLQAAYVSSGTFDPTIYQPKYINL